ncbi:MAG: thiamine pyrophosphate-dependent dehydrogenase E1 component subunit alpha [Acidobacteriia bacterium]|nr:thiamine pyrophosphate-dependent dehydrogenase E1 component subunit alpha [Terriglobia bacterium]
MASNETRLSLYRALVRARELENGIISFHPYFHSAVGEEAVVVGSAFGLRPDDVYIPHYRGALAANLVRGASMHRLVAGVLGKVTAYDRGRFFSEVRGRAEPKNFSTMGGFLGTTITYGAGAALSAKLRKTDEVAVVVFGDGCANKGEFHESLNLAGVLKLPAVFICQNNQFCISMSAERGTAGRIVDRAIGYGMPGILADGNDVEAVNAALMQAVAHARAGKGPSLIDALTYRVSGHWTTDPAAYQPQEERRHWRERDPILVFENRLKAEGLVTDGDIKSIHEQAASEVTAAIAQAKSDPPPGPEELRPELVYAVGRS